MSGDGIGCFSTLLMSADPTTALESQSICVCIHGVAINKPDCFYYSFPAMLMTKRRVGH